MRHTNEKKKRKERKAKTVPDLEAWEDGEVDLVLHVVPLVMLKF